MFDFIRKLIIKKRTVKFLENRYWLYALDLCDDKDMPLSVIDKFAKNKAKKEYKKILKEE